MKRRWDRVLAVVLLVFGVVALLPVTGIYTHTSCEWVQTPTVTGASTLKPGVTLSLSVRAGDPALQKKMRDALEAGLTAKGVAKFVDNPVARPRAQVVMEEMAGRWTPFSAPLKMKVRVLLNERKGAGDVLDASIVIDGTCTGLVSRDQWQDEPLGKVLDEALTQLAPR
jgi:hypothetical protein